MAAMEKPCTLLVHFDKGSPSMANEIKADLESGDGPAKADAMRRAISLLLNGETLPHLFITVVRYVQSSEDHAVQKLLLLYLETVDKRDAATGKVLPEMILICQNLRNNLQHPNEYIRGVTLRFLCRLSEPELLEPLVPSILANLEHRHHFVRRHALSAISAIYRRPHGDQLIPDAPELVERALASEQDAAARRNAFLMLCACAQERAVAYLLSNAERVTEWPDLLQMAAVDLIRKVSQGRADKGRYIKIIIDLLSAPSTAVVYECAGALVSLSSAPTAVRAAANTYCELLSSQSDNNVKLIILDRLQELRTSHREVMVDMVMDVLRALASPNVDVRRKVLDLVLDLLTPRNVEEVVLYLKKEVVKTQSAEAEKGGEYRQMLVQAIHACAVKYPEVAGSVVHLLMDFLGDTNVAAAVDVVLFVREIIETNPKLRVSMIQRLIDTFYQIRASRVCACALWILGEYSLSLSEVESAISTIKQCLGDLPFYTVSEEGESTDSSKPAQPVVNSVTVSSRRPVVLADGTYATQSAATEAASSAPAVALGSLASTQNLRSLILSGDFFLAAVVACTLTKLVLRLEEVQPSKVEANKACTGALLIMVSILQLGQSSYLPHPIDNDSYDRIVVCVRLLCNTGDDVRKILLQSCRQSFVKMLAEKQFRETEEMKAKAQISHAQPDDLIDFYHLKSRRGMSQLELEDAVQDDLKAATGQFTKDADDTNKLNRILQLTGFSDPVYAEAFVTVHHYDIVLDVTVINRTKETLQNLCLELATMGDLKLVDRPQNYTFAPQSSKQIRANIKVSSTETGVIFGNIVYETSNVMERSVVVLNDIHIDIMDYISPASCADVAFRNMWAEFEWENKVAVNTVIQDEKEFLDHIIKSTNMKCLTPPSALDGECGFLAANLYAKSVFGEDALVNISVEKQTDGKLSGYIRIRSKTQGIALSLGDKITLRWDRGEVLADALKTLLWEGRQQDMLRASAFIKRLATFALSFGSAEAIAALITMKHLLQKNSKCRNMLENDSGGGSLSCLVAKYDPEAKDPYLSGALASVLWELSLLEKHYDISVSSMASNILSMANLNPTQNPVPILNVNPLEAYRDMSIERELSKPASKVSSLNCKKKRRGKEFVALSPDVLEKADCLVDKDEISEKLQRHFAVLRGISENERLRAKLNHTLSSINLYNEYKMQTKKNKKSKTGRKKVAGA